MFTTEYNVLFSFLTSLIITYVAIPKVIFFSERYKLNDVTETRVAHKRSIPVFGGRILPVRLRPPSMKYSSEKPRVNI